MSQNAPSSLHSESSQSLREPDVYECYLQMKGKPGRWRQFAKCCIKKTATPFLAMLTVPPAHEESSEELLPQAKITCLADIMKRSSASFKVIIPSDVPCACVTLFPEGPKLLCDQVAAILCSHWLPRSRHFHPSAKRRRICRLPESTVCVLVGSCYETYPWQEPGCPASFPWSDGPVPIIIVLARW